MYYITVMVGDIPDQMIKKSANRKLYFRSNTESSTQSVIVDEKSLNPEITRENSSIIKELFLLK